MKNVQRPFHAPKNLSQNYPQQRSHFRKTFFPLLASALNAYRMDGFDLSLLIISPRFCLAQLKKNPVLLASMLLTDCHLMLVFLSLPVPLQCFYVTKDTLFSRFLTADCLFVCTISHLLWLNVDEERRKQEKGNQCTCEMCIALKVHDKTHKKTFRISLKHSNIHLSFLFFWQIFDFFLHSGMRAFPTSNATDRQLFDFHFFCLPVWRYCRFLFCFCK